jgi:hypothetical protein
MTVGPKEIAPWRLYALPVIAWAIGLFGLDLLLAREVRANVSPDAVIATGSASHWRQLGRWIDRRASELSIREVRRRDRARAIALRTAARSGPRDALDASAAWIGSMTSIGA